MNFIKKIVQNIQEKPHIFGAYILTLNYIEVIHYMLVSVLYLGKIAIIITGIFLMALVTVSVLLIYFRVSPARLPVLLFADFHVAASISFVFFFFYLTSDWNIVSAVLFTTRAILIPCEILMIYMLSSDRGKTLFR